MTYNNSYVSSSSALKSFASISDDTNDTLKDAKFFEVFSLTYMKDLPDNAAKADCNGNNCIVGCSCNTANGWQPTPTSYSTRTSVGIIPPTSAQAKLYVTATTNFKTAYANGKLNSSPAQTSCRKQALPPYFIKISYSTSDKGNSVGFYQPATITTDDKTLTSVQIKYTGQIGKVMPSGWQYSATSYTYRLGSNTGEQNYTIPYSPKDVGLEGLGSYLSKPEVSLSLNGTTVIANTRLEEDNSFSILKNEWPASISFNGKSYDLVFEQNASCPDGYFKKIDDATGWSMTQASHNLEEIKVSDSLTCYKSKGCKNSNGAYDKSTLKITGNDLTNYINPGPSTKFGNVECLFMSCKDNTILSAEDKNIFSYTTSSKDIATGLSCKTETVNGCRRGYAYNPCTTPKTVNGYRCSTEYTAGYFDIYYRYIYSKDAPKTMLNVYKLEYNQIGYGDFSVGAFEFDATSSNCKDLYGARISVGYDESSYGKYSGTKIAVSNLTAASSCGGIVAIPVTGNDSYIPASAGSNQAQKLYPFECTRFYTHTTTRNGPYFLYEHLDQVYKN